MAIAYSRTTVSKSVAPLTGPAGLRPLGGSQCPLSLTGSSGLTEALHHAGHRLALIDLGSSFETHCSGGHGKGIRLHWGRVSDPGCLALVTVAGPVAEAFYDGVLDDQVWNLHRTAMAVMVSGDPEAAWDEQEIRDAVAYVDSRWSSIWRLAQAMLSEPQRALSYAECAEFAQ